jgi:hypothetical protein
MHNTRKLRLIQKLAKEVEKEVEDNKNYFLMHSRKYYLKEGKLYTSSSSTKSVGRITMKGNIELHKHSKTKSYKSSNNSSRRNINLNKKNKTNNGSTTRSMNKSSEEISSPEENVSSTVTGLNRNTVLYESNKSPESVEPMESVESSEVQEQSIEEKPLEETIPEEVTEESNKEEEEESNKEEESI